MNARILGQDFEKRPIRVDMAAASAAFAARSAAAAWHAAGGNARRDGRPGMTVDESAAYWRDSPTPDPSDPHYAVRWATLAEGWQPPSTDELRGLLKAADWSQQAAGRMTGYTGRTARNWCSGATRIPFAAWFVLRETWHELRAAKARGE